MDAAKFDSLYEEEYYDEIDEYDNTDVIDNSNLHFYNEDICIRLNNNIGKNERLKKSEEILLKKFPKLKKLPSDSRMQLILEGMFPEGFKKQMYIRNLTFTNESGRDIKL